MHNWAAEQGKNQFLDFECGYMGLIKNYFGFKQILVLHLKKIVVVSN